MIMCLKSWGIIRDEEEVEAVDNNNNEGEEANFDFKNTNFT
jgi:hypothetical protein